MFVRLFVCVNQAMIMMAIDMHRAMQEINEEFGHGLRLRIGMHSGSVLGGIMGTKKLNFDLWGETVEMVRHVLLWWRVVL